MVMIIKCVSIKEMEIIFVKLIVIKENWITNVLVCDYYALVIVTKLVKNLVISWSDRGNIFYPCITIANMAI